MPTEFRRRDSSSPTIQYVCLAILFAGAMLFQIRYAQDIWRTENVDVPFVMPASASAALEIVRPAAEKLGLHTGDILLAVNGQPSGDRRFQHYRWDGDRALRTHRNAAPEWERIGCRRRYLCRSGIRGVV